MLTEIVVILYRMHNAAVSPPACLPLLLCDSPVRACPSLLDHFSRRLVKWSPWRCDALPADLNMSPSHRPARAAAAFLHLNRLFYFALLLPPSPPFPSPVLSPRAPASPSKSSILLFTVNPLHARPHPWLWASGWAVGKSLTPQMLSDRWGSGAETRGAERWALHSRSGWCTQQKCLSWKTNRVWIPLNSFQQLFSLDRTLQLVFSWGRTWRCRAGKPILSWRLAWFGNFAVLHECWGAILCTITGLAHSVMHIDSLLHRDMTVFLKITVIFSQNL